jgi:hypothetical protein
VAITAVTRVFASGAKAARLTLVDGLVGAVVSNGERSIAVFSFNLRYGQIADIELLTDPETIVELGLESVRQPGDGTSLIAW